jgi:hypothetical protein
MPHSPRSPDGVPSDFHLFPTIKERLEQTGITDEDQLFVELHTILRSIPREELQRVFEAWRQRIQNINQSNGDDTD